MHGNGRPTAPSDLRQIRGFPSAPGSEAIERDAKMLVERFYAALADDNVPAVLALATDDVTVTQSERLPWGGRFVGSVELGRFAAGVRAYITSEVRIDCMIAAGARVAAIGRTQGTVCATGRSFDIPLVHLFTVNAGRLAALEVLVDVPAMIAALR